MDELRRLLAAAKQQDNCRAKTNEGVNNSPEWHKLLLIGIYTGLRLGDCCRLDWSQINVAEGVIQIVPKKTSRHHQRMVTIPIHESLGRALISRDNYSADAQSGYHFMGPVLPVIAELYSASRWRVNDGLTRIFRAARIQTSIRIEGRHRRTPEATFHSLRHTFVSFAANAGVPLHVVQSIVGHESTAMTRHYYHENLDALKSAVAAIPTL